MNTLNPNYLRLSLFGLACLLSGLTACKRDSEKSALTDYVPANTTYLMAKTEPYPSAVTEHYYAMFEPLFELAEQGLQIATQKLTEENQKESKNQLAAAILKQFAGNMSSDGLKRLGIDLNARYIIYGLDKYPVWRWELSSAERLNQTLENIQREAGQTWRQEQLDGKNYWKITPADVDLAFYLATVENHFVTAVLPTNRESELLPIVLATEQPANPLNLDQHISAFNREHDYLPYGSGYVDLVGLANKVFDSADIQSGLAAFAASPGCKAEVLGLLQKTPRIISGSRVFDKQQIINSTTLVLDPTLNRELSAIVPPGVAFDSNPGGQVSFSYGLNFSALKEWLQTTATKIQSKPFTCAYFDKLNQSLAAADLAQLDKIPPLANQIKGVRVRMDDLTMDIKTGELASLGRAYGAVISSNTQGLLGMAQLAIPELANVDLNKISQTQSFDLPENPIQLKQAHLRLNQNTIGLAVGADSQAGLEKFMAPVKNPDNRTLLSFGYSFDLILNQAEGWNQLMEQLRKDANQLALEEANAEILGEMFEQFTQVLNHLGGEHGLIQFSDQGLEFEQSLYFK